MVGRLGAFAGAMLVCSFVNPNINHQWTIFTADVWLYKWLRFVLNGLQKNDSHRTPPKWWFNVDLAWQEVQTATQQTNPINSSHLENIYLGSLKRLRTKTAQIQGAIMCTPQKSNIDIKKGHILKEFTFSKPSFWDILGIHVGFRGCNPSVRFASWW